MRIRSIIGATCACLTVVSINVNATVIDGLDWLPFTNTLSMTTNDVDTALLPGGSLVGWRFASNLEVEGMLTSIHPGWIEGSSTANQGITDELGGLLGYTFLTNAGVAGAREVFGATGDSGGGGCCRAAFDFSDGFRGQPVAEDFVDITIVNRNRTTNQFGRPVASFLVKEVSSVPVPAAVWLFGSGLLGLIGFSKHKTVFSDTRKRDVCIKDEGAVRETRI